MKNEYDAWFHHADTWLVKPKKEGLLTTYIVYNPARKGDTKPFANLKDALWEAAKRNTEGYKA